MKTTNLEKKLGGGGGGGWVSAFSLGGAGKGKQENNCAKIILQSMHKCRNYGPDKQNL